MLHALGMLVADLFKSRTRLEAENLFLRHQLNIALRRAPPRLRLRGSDRALLILMTMLWPRLLRIAQLVQPETILRWHRAGFKAFWRWKSRNRVGRPKIDRGLRDLIQRMSRENPLWGASRIPGELLMLGFEVAQSTVSKYMARPPDMIFGKDRATSLLTFACTRCVCAQVRTGGSLRIDYRVRASHRSLRPMPIASPVERVRFLSGHPRRHLQG